MHIACLADPHGFHDQIKIPKCDLLICAGDLSMQGEIGVISSFNEWLGRLNIPAIVIAGNHDLTLENNRYVAKSILTNATYLEDGLVKVRGLKVYGSPYSPKIAHWAFGYNEEDAYLTWNMVPEDTDILVTHGPPYKILDKTYYGNRHVGCKALLEKVNAIKPKVHIFGHIHEARGFKTISNTHFVNASICDYPKYENIRRPIIVKL